MHQRAGVVYPFSAIVGQEKMKKALLLNAINPKIGGVLLRGEKGTALTEEKEGKKVAREIKMASIKSIAIDTEQGFVTFRLVKQLCTEMGGTYLQLEELKSAPIVSTIQKNLSYGEKK